MKNISPKEVYRALTGKGRFDPDEAGRAQRDEGHPISLFLQSNPDRMERAYSLVMAMKESCNSDSFRSDYYSDCFESVERTFNSENQQGFLNSLQLLADRIHVEFYFVGKDENEMDVRKRPVQTWLCSDKVYEALTGKEKHEDGRNPDTNAHPVVVDTSDPEKREWAYSFVEAFKESYQADFSRGGRKLLSGYYSECLDDIDEARKKEDPELFKNALQSLVDKLSNQWKHGLSRFAY